MIKNKQINIRLTDSEYNEIKKEFHQYCITNNSNITLSDFFRFKLGLVAGMELNK